MSQLPSTTFIHEYYYYLYTLLLHLTDAAYIWYFIALIFCHFAASFLFTLYFHLFTLPSSSDNRTKPFLNARKSIIWLLYTSKKYIISVAEIIPVLQLGCCFWVEYILYYKMSRKVLGTLSLNPILWVMVVAMIITPLYTYHMAVSKKEVPPYPHATITDTATHYPQDIVFRYVMLVNSSFLALSFFVVYRWV